MSFWDTFANLLAGESKKYIVYRLPPERVDNDADNTPVTAGAAYLRLWLVEMRLAQGRQFFTSFYPVVHSAVRFNYGGNVESIPFIAGPGFLKDLTKEKLDQVIQCNQPLTPLFPFNTGTVDVQAGLFAVPSQLDPVGKFLGSLGRFSKLLPVPELSSVFTLAGPVYDSIQDLLGLSGTSFELGYQNTFTGAGGGGGNDLRPGYFCAILKEAAEIDLDSLCVVNDGLMVGAVGTHKEFLSQPRKALNAASYMLFRLEKQSSQDWESLKAISALVYQAQELTTQLKFAQVKDSLLPTIRATVFRSPDIARDDKLPMVARIEKLLADWGLQAAAPRQRLSLSAIMQRPVPEMSPQKEADLKSLLELYSGPAV